MTEQDFIKMYLGFVECAMAKTDLEMSKPHVEHHQIRCFAFYLADNLNQWGRREIAEAIFNGTMTSCSDMTQLTEWLELEHDLVNDDAGELREWIKTMSIHIEDYFGV